MIWVQLRMFLTEFLSSKLPLKCLVPLLSVSSGFSSPMCQMLSFFFYNSPKHKSYIVKSTTATKSLPQYRLLLKFNFCFCDKILWQKEQLREERICFRSQFQVTVHHRSAELQTAGLPHLQSRAERNVCTHLTLLLAYTQLNFSTLSSRLPS